MWWLGSIIQTLGRLRQKDKFKDSLSYIVKPAHKGSLGKTVPDCHLVQAH